MRDHLDQLEQQLVELTERGAHRRRRARTDVLAIAATIAVVGAVAAIIATVGSGTHHGAPASQRHAAPRVHRSSPPVTTAPTPSRTTFSAPPPTGGKVPAGFGPSSFTAISELDWWLLGSAPCASPPCTTIVRTTDGGRSFVSIPAPKTDGVSQVRFADVKNGFAFGPDLWATHDGGAHWRLAFRGSVSDLAISGGYAYALVAPGKVGRLERAPVGSDQWTMLAAAGNVIGSIWAQGSDVLAESANSSRQQLMVSRDRGQTFTAHPVPPSVQCEFQEPQPPVLWEHCATGTMSGVWRSTDGGQTFAATAGAHSWAGPELPNSAAFAAASADTAMVGYRQLSRTTDGGATWTPIAASPNITWWQYLGFTDATHGVALGYLGSLKPADERLYYTTDGGASYHLVRIG